MIFLSNHSLFLFLPFIHSHKDQKQKRKKLLVFLLFTKQIASKNEEEESILEVTNMTSKNASWRKIIVFGTYIGCKIWLEVCSPTYFFMKLIVVFNIRLIEMLLHELYHMWARKKLPLKAISIIINVEQDVDFRTNEGEINVFLNMSYSLYANTNIKCVTSYIVFDDLWNLFRSLSTWH